MTIDEVIIPRYTPEIVHFYKKDGTFLGVINNEHEFNKLRIILLKNDLIDECYFMWNDIKITLDYDGSMSNFPVGLYDTVSKDLAELFKLRREKNL